MNQLWTLEELLGCILFKWSWNLHRKPVNSDVLSLSLSLSLSHICTDGNSFFNDPELFSCTLVFLCLLYVIINGHLRFCTYSVDSPDCTLKIRLSMLAFESNFREI